MRLTLRELIAAADARRRDEWDRTSHVLATLINLHRDPDKSRPAVAADLNPYRKPRRRRRQRSLFTRDDLHREFDRLTERKPARSLSLSRMTVIEDT